jgi:hypothetical protein
MIEKHRNLFKCFFFVWLALSFPLATLAKGEEPLACAGCGVVVLIPVAAIALGIALLIWVARDAKARGMDSAVIWMILVFFTNVLGLILYLFSRPQGSLIRCPHCQNNRLQASAKCPHCGNS